MAKIRVDGSTYSYSAAEATAARKEFGIAKGAAKAALSAATYYDAFDGRLGILSREELGNGAQFMRVVADTVTEGLARGLVRFRSEGASIRVNWPETLPGMELERGSGSPTDVFVLGFDGSRVEVGAVSYPQNAPYRIYGRLNVDF